jgi:hypothetical protein
MALRQLESLHRLFHYPTTVARDLGRSQAAITHQKPGEFWRVLPDASAATIGFCHRQSPGSSLEAEAASG